MASLIHLAASSGSLSAVKGMIKANPSLLNAKCSRRRTPLMYAVHDGPHLPIIRFLLAQKECDVDALAKGSYTAYFYACKKGFIEAAEMLKKAGAKLQAGRIHTALNYAAKGAFLSVLGFLLGKEEVDVNEVAGWTYRIPIIYAENAGHVEAVRLLLRVGADVKACDRRGQTALMYASRKGHVEVLKLLLSYQGAEHINIKDEHGVTAFVYAAQGVHVEAMKVLYNHEAFSHESDNTAYRTMAKGGHRKVIDFIAEHGCYDDGSREEVLLGACEGGHVGLAQIVYTAGMEVDYQDADTGNTARIIAARSDYLDVVSWLLTVVRASVNLQNNKRRTALMEAVCRPTSKALVEILIEAGASLDLTDDEGMNALMLADQDTSAMEAMEAILQAYRRASALKMDLVVDEGRTALHHAAKAQGAANYYMLLEYGANPSMADHDGCTPLMYVSFENYDIVKCLVDNMTVASINHQDANGTTALMQACSTYATTNRSLAYLIRKGADATIIDDEGWNAWMMAAYYNRVNILPLLWETPAKDHINDRRNDGLRALHVASFESEDHCVEWLIQQGGADVSLRTVSKEQTCLMLAASHVSDATMKTLLNLAEVRKMIDYVDYKGCTVLYLACEKGNEEVIRHLLAAHANPLSTDARNSPLAARNITSGCYQMITKAMQEPERTYILFKLFYMSTITHGINEVHNKHTIAGEDEVEVTKGQEAEKKSKEELLQEAAGPCLMGRIEERKAIVLPRVQVTSFYHSVSSSSTAAGAGARSSNSKKRGHDDLLERQDAQEEQKKLVDVVGFAVNGGLPTQLYADLLDMMIMKWDYYTYRGLPSRKNQR